jgi:hypothetical protein
MLTASDPLVPPAAFLQFFLAGLLAHRFRFDVTPHLPTGRPRLGVFTAGTCASGRDGGEPPVAR